MALRMDWLLDLCLRLWQSSLCNLIFFFYCNGDHRDLHSFPTRRSSDLTPVSNGARLAPDGGGPRDHPAARRAGEDRKSTRLNSSHTVISYAVFCLKKKMIIQA